MVTKALVGNTQTIKLEGLERPQFLILSAFSKMLEIKATLRVSSEKLTLDELKQRLAKDPSAD